MVRSVPDVPTARERLIGAGTDLFRRQGYVATSVDQICAGAGVSKGSFFHHFGSKEELATECLRAWDEAVARLQEAAAGEAGGDPIDRARRFMDAMVVRFADPSGYPSCLAGTTAQEVAETHPTLRDAANACFVNASGRFKTLLDDAFATGPLEVETAELSMLWSATLQGALVLAKASGDASCIPRSLAHVSRYIAALLEEARRLRDANGHEST